jgi:S1-C subfamily serine protease
VHATRNIEVYLSDGRRVSAKIVGEDHLTDLAILKINADRLVPAEWGDSEAMEVGALVWAIGSPFGLERSITFGILSAKHRAGHAGTPFQDLMQTDVAVNPGNSGGPLVDTMGRVVGINTAIVGPSYQGVSFAIPSNVARDVFHRLKKEGRVTRGWLGVELERVPAEEVKRLNLPNANGAYVVRLADERLNVKSPARLAGLQASDIIIRWNDEPVESPTVLFGLIGKSEVGGTSRVTLLRRGQEVTLEVKVATRPDQIN